MKKLVCVCWGFYNSKVVQKTFFRLRRPKNNYIEDGLFFILHIEPGLGAQSLESLNVAFISGPSKLTYRPVMFSFPTHITLFLELDHKHRVKKRKGGKNNAGHFWQTVCVSGFGSGSAGGRRHPSRALNATTESPVNSGKTTRVQVFFVHKIPQRTKGNSVAQIYN